MTFLKVAYLLLE